MSENAPGRRVGEEEQTTGRCIRMEPGCRTFRVRHANGGGILGHSSGPFVIREMPNPCPTRPRSPPRSTPSCASGVSYGALRRYLPSTRLSAWRQTHSGHAAKRPIRRRHGRVGHVTHHCGRRPGLRATTATTDAISSRLRLRTRDK